MNGEIKRHYAALFGACETGYLCIGSMGKDGKINNHQWFDIKNGFDEAANTTVNLSSDKNTYYGLCLYSDKSSGRGSVATASWLPALYIDLDFGAAGSASAYAGTKNPPASLEDVKSFLADIGYPPPSLIEGTGNGMHAYWLLDTPFHISTETDRDRATALYRGFIAHARLEASARGWLLDGVGDLARIGRPPGTINHGKPSRPHEPKPVTLLEGDYSVRYSMEILEGVAKPTAVKVAKASSAHTPFDGEGTAKFAGIHAGCGFIQHAVAEAETLPEDQWYAALGVVAHVENASAIAHRISAPYPKYDRSETDWYLERAGKYPPRTCADIRQRFQLPACEKCLFRQSPSAHHGTFNSPIALGYAKDPNVVSLASEYAYEAEGRMAYHRDQMIPTADDSFRRLEARRAKPAPEALTSYKHALVAHTSDYLPGKSLTEWQEGRLTLNTYRAPTLTPVLGDWSAIRAHFELLFGDPGITKHVLDYLAHLVQKPAEKVGHVLLILGGQGVGKTTALSWMRDIVGPSNFKVLTNKAAKSDWTAELMEKSLLVIEELMGEDRLSTYNDLKVYVTDDYAPANQKFARLRRLKTPRGIVAMSNHPDPIILEPDDRRFYVVDINAEKQPEAYYRALYEKAPSQVPAFMHHLLTRDLTDFQSHDAPMTDAKQALIELGMLPVEKEVRGGMLDERGPFRADLGTVSDVRDWLCLDPRFYGASDADITKALRRAGAVRLKQVRTNKETVRLWAFRQADRWSVATPDDLRSAYRPYMASPTDLAA